MTFFQRKQIIWTSIFRTPIPFFVLLYLTLGGSLAVLSQFPTYVLFLYTNIGVVPEDMSDAHPWLTYNNDACFSLCVTTKFCSFDVNALYLLLFDWTGYIYRTTFGQQWGQEKCCSSIQLIYLIFVYWCERWKSQFLPALCLIWKVTERKFSLVYSVLVFKL